MSLPLFVLCIYLSPSHSHAGGLFELPASLYWCHQGLDSALSDQEMPSIDDSVEEYLARMLDDEGFLHWYDFGISRGRFADLEKHNKNVDGIVKLGRRAVPELIRHLDDSRLTKMRGVPQKVMFGNTLVRVQDLALYCIQRILRIRFYVRTHTSKFFSSEEREVRELVIDEIQRWWDQFGAKPPIEGFIARLDEGRLEDRLHMIGSVEELDPKAVDTV